MGGGGRGALRVRVCCFVVVMWAMDGGEEEEEEEEGLACVCISWVWVCVYVCVEG
jgi:hypothetical protein